MTDKATSHPLAIIGIGCLFPKAAGPGFYWANIKHGVDCIGEVPSTHWDPADYFDEDPKRADMTYARRGGFLDAIDFNPLEFGIAPRDIEATDTTQLLGLVAAKQALADARVVLANPDREGGGGRCTPSLTLRVRPRLAYKTPLPPFRSPRYLPYPRVVSFANRREPCGCETGRRELLQPSR